MLRGINIDRRKFSFVDSSQIILQDSGIFEMLGLAQELGIEELWRSCEEHVFTTLSPGNACALLTAALDAQERVPGIYLSGIALSQCCFTICPPQQ